MTVSLMKTKLNVLLPGVVAAAVIIWLVATFSPPAQGKARLTFDIDGAKRAFEGEVVPGMTVLDAIKTSVQAGNISFYYAAASDGSDSVLAVNGKRGGQETFRLDVNGQPVDLASIDKTDINPGDEIMVTALK